MDSIRPSSADTWMLCKGQPRFIEALNIPDNNTWYAAEGTAAHHLAAHCLEEGLDAEHFEGWNIAVSQETGKVITWGDPYGGDDYEISEAVGGETHWLYEVDPEMIGHVQEYIDYVRREAYGHELLVEQKVNVSKVLAVKGRSGTSDAIILPADDETPLTFIDLKYGQGVPVYAPKNRQLRIYAAGYVEHYEEMLGPWETVKVVIHQPRLNVVSEWELSVEDLKKFARVVRRKSQESQAIVDYEKHLTPGDKQCKFCNGKAFCPKLAEMVEEVLDGDLDLITGDLMPFTDLAELGKRRKLVELLESWAKAVRDTVYKEIEAGNHVPGWKPVVGRKGSRYWTDEKKAAAKMKKSFRLRDDQMYTQKIITPTQVESLVSKARYQTLKEMGLIGQDDGKTTIVPEEDPRDAVQIDPMFDDLE